MMSHLPSRVVLWLLACCVFSVGDATACEKHAAAAQQTQVKTEAPAEDLHIYLLIGQSNMAGRATVLAEMAGVIDRCYLLNDKNEWVPAKNPLNLYSTIRKGEGMQKLGPGYSFAKAMLEADPDIKIGLVVNARGGSKIEQWLGKSKYYFGIRGRAKAAMKTGTIKGVIWHQGESNSGNPDDYMDQLKALIGNLRSDLGDTDLPFVAGQVTNTPPLKINDVIATLPKHVHATAAVSSEGLKTTDRWHFDTDSQIELGHRYAKEMLKLQAELEKADKPKPPKDMKFIDPHVHAMSLKEGGLDAVIEWMDRNNIERCVVSPLNHKGSRAWTTEEKAKRNALYAKHKGRIDRMAVIDAGEVETVDEAIAILKQEKQDGAIAFGEHYGRDLVFDDPKNLLLYEACEKVGLPIMFHIDQNKNMVTKGMPEVDKVLKQFPDCTVIAHAYWWRQLKDADRQLTEHDNLYADMSGHVVPNVLNRDRKFAREFIIRHQDKLLWATDEGWWSFKDKQTKYKHYTFFEELDLPDEVRYKLYRGNAEKLFGWEKPEAE